MVFETGIDRFVPIELCGEVPTVLLGGGTGSRVESGLNRFCQ